MNKFLFILLTLVSVSGCNDSNKTIIAPGSDKDTHGCIFSAGYTWCEYTKKCERPWELAKQVGFKDDSESFLKYCSQKDKSE